MDFLFSIIMLRRLSSKKGKFEGVELGEKINSAPLHRTPPSPPKNTPKMNIEKEAHQIATFMQKRKDSVDHTNTAPVKKYKPMPKLDVQESSPVSIHVIKKDRISSHRSKPPVIDYRRSEPPIRPVEHRIADTKTDRSSTVKTIALQRPPLNSVEKPVPSQKPSNNTPVTHLRSPVNTISQKSSLKKSSPLRSYSKSPLQSPLDTPSLQERTSNRRPNITHNQTSLTTSKKNSTPNKPERTSQRPSQVSTRPSSLPKSTLSTKLSSDMFGPSGSIAKTLKTPISSAKSSHSRPHSQSKPKSKASINTASIQKLFKKNPSPERRTSKKKSNEVEWSVVSNKTQYKPVILSFILSNWERYNGTVITESRWKKAETYMQHFSNLPLNERYLLANLCTGLKIRKKYSRKGI